MNCPVCGGDSSKKLGKIDRFYEPLFISICLECDSRFQDPLPKNPDSFYDEKYYLGKAEYSYIDERTSWQFDKYVHFSRLKRIKRYISSGKFLDIGCSFGGFALSASSYFDSYGIDVSDFAIKNGTKFVNNLSSSPPKLIKGDLTQEAEIDKILGKKLFDVITMIEVAEHLKDPINFFPAIYRRLRRGGLLVIQTANFEGWQAKKAGLNYHYYLPGHLVYYTSTGLKQLLKNSGFTSFVEFIPVDFSLLSKLKKSRGKFTKISDYLKWFNIIKYHLQSKFFRHGFPSTSSYVIYAFRD